MACWGMLSDVHGNLEALQRALVLLRSAGATRLAFLGDYLGRGDSDACARLIQETADVVVVGNRDYDWLDRVNPRTRSWILSLPRRVEVDELLLTHGDDRLTPRLGTGQVRRNFRDAAAELERARARVWAFGHSHHARCWRLSDAGTEVTRLHGHAAELDQLARYAVNVGTTGLPFPGKGPASVALLDLEESTVQHLVVPPPLHLPE